MRPTASESIGPPRKSAALSASIGLSSEIAPPTSKISCAEIVGIVLAAVVSLGSPWLASRKVDSATSALDSGNLAQAAKDADRARSLDPLLPEPLFTLGLVAARAGDVAAARSRFEQATRLQPENSSTWFRLGQFEFYGPQDMCRAYTAFNHAYTLDPNGSEWTKGGPLDLARDAVNNDHACG